MGLPVWASAELRAERKARVAALAALIEAECPPEERVELFGTKEERRALAARKAEAARLRAGTPTDADKAALSARLAAGRRAAAARGRHQAGPAPYGYRRTRDRSLEPDPEEVPVVRLVFRLALKASVARVAAELNRRGWRTRKGSRWSRPALHWILRNDTYLGRVHFGPVRVRGRHPAIVAPIVFNKVQKRLRDRRRRAVIARALATARRAT